MTVSSLFWLTHAGEGSNEYGQFPGLYEAVLSCLFSVLRMSLGDKNVSVSSKLLYSRDPSNNLDAEKLFSQV